MLQNKLLFNQSSVSLEIIGLPDYSNNEDKDQISIISQWKLIIIDKPLIEGNIDHLSSIMDAFYIYSNSLINNQNSFYESKLIDIKSDNFYTHNILLKSSKPEVDPLNISIGNSVLSDIINCFDQLNSSNKVRIVNSNLFSNSSKKVYFNFINKHNIFNVILPPLISICSLFLVSSTLIYFYNVGEEKENNAFIDSKLILYSIKSIKRIT
tara:strand:+ start:201 stop:830 length:630 start_codon:yes stop_codon:yes gene_type:complete